MPNKMFDVDYRTNWNPVELRIILVQIGAQQKEKPTTEKSGGNLSLPYVP
jgi:hypothetical protein